jgi:hypothetical protein
MSSFSRRRRIVANDGRMLGSSAQQSLTSLLQAIGQRGICGRSFWVPTAKTTCIAHQSNAAVMPREGRGFRLKVVSVDVPGMEASPCMGPPASPAPTTRCRSCRCPLSPCTAHFVALRAPSNRASVCFRVHKSRSDHIPRAHAYQQSGVTPHAVIVAESVCSTIRDRPKSHTLTFQFSSTWFECTVNT